MFLTSCGNKISNLKNNSAGSALIELVLYMAIAGILLLTAVITMVTLSGEADNYIAQSSITNSSQVTHSSYTLNSAALPDEDTLINDLASNMGNYSFTKYQNGTSPSTDSMTVSISRDDQNQVTLCSKSKTGLVYCLRNNYAGLLNTTIVDSDPQQTDSIFGDLVASVNPLQMVFPEQAQAASSYISSPLLSRCVGTVESEVRECLADPGEGTKTVGDAIPGWGDSSGDSSGDSPQDPPSNNYYVGPENLVGVDSLTVQGNSQIIGKAASRGRVRILDSARICGSVAYGEGTPSPVGGVPWAPNNPNINGTGGGVCPGTTLGTFNGNFPNVVLPSNIQTENSNSRLSGADPVPGSVWQRGNVNWNSSTRVLRVNYSELELQGTQPYFLCRIVLSGGATLKVSGTTRIFFDSPENCNNETQLLVVDNGSKLLTSTGLAGFFFVGSDTVSSNILFSGGSNSLSMVFYAPRSNITINGGSNFDGAIVGKTLSVGGGSNLIFSFDGSDYLLPTQ
jgi:Tfp pilus assembly protein PilE